MSQADRDHEKWLEASRKWQQRELYRAKETGSPYYIDELGQVIIENQQHKAKKGDQE